MTICHAGTAVSLFPTCPPGHSDLLQGQLVPWHVKQLMNFFSEKL